MCFPGNWFSTKPFIQAAQLVEMLRMFINICTSVFICVTDWNDAVTSNKAIQGIRYSWVPADFAKTSGKLDRSQCKESKICFHSPLSGHPYHVFSRKVLEPQNLMQFAVKMLQKLANRRTMTQISSVLKVIMIHVHAKFQTIPSMCSP